MVLGFLLVYFHSLFYLEAKALTSLRLCTGSSEPFLLADIISINKHMLRVRNNFFFFFSTKTFVVGTQKTVSMLEMMGKKIFTQDSTKTYVVGTQRNCLNETVLLSTRTYAQNYG